MKKSLNTILCTTISVSLLTIFTSYTVEDLVSKKDLVAKEAEVAIVDTPEQTVAMLNDLIIKNAAFSIQITHPELAIKTKIWQRKGTVALPSTVPWETFKKDVHQFGVDLYALLEKDERGTYYHLDDLRKNNALYNALTKLNQSIIQREKKEGNSESISKLGKLPSRLLIHKINWYATAFYSQKLLASLKAFFKKFEERAKRLRMKEEQAQKAAERGAPSGWLDSSDFEYTRPDLETTIDEYESVRPELPELDEEKFDFTPKETEIDWGF